MEFIKKHKALIIIFALLICCLVLSFFFAADYKTTEKINDTAETQTAETVQDNANDSETDLQQKNDTEEESAENEKNIPEDTDFSAENGIVRDGQTAESVPAETSVPLPSDMPAQVNETQPETKNVCTLSITCYTALREGSDLTEEKRAILPDSGIILAPTEVEFHEGESVFNILRRETKKNKIHMEFVNTPVYGTAYIEGIGNLYEFDCGELSGWMYKVNGVFPSRGSSNVKLKPGDVIEWVYTCDLGADVGGYSGGLQKDE